MYPGYSPADHEYGKAAEEYGQLVAKAKAMGIEIKHEDAEYEIGQAKGVKRKTLAALKEVKAAKGGTSGAGTSTASEASIKSKTKEPAITNGHASTGKVEEARPEGDNPYFVIDTNPTPVKIPGMSFQTSKQNDIPPEAVEAKKHKKAKKKHDGEMPKGEDSHQLKTEDISEQVDARMKEKEKKKKMKEEKKRKRESEGEPVAAAVEQPEPAAAKPSSIITPGEADRPKKKKKKVKHPEQETLPDRTVVVSKKRASEEEEEDKGGVENNEEEGTSKNKKRKKNNKNKEAAAVTVTGVAS